MDSPSAQSYIRFNDELERLSDGRITSTFYPGGILGDTPQMEEQVAEGVLDFHWGYVSTTLSPRLDVVNVPGLAWTWEDAAKFLQSSEILSIFDTVAKEVNWHMLGTIPCCFNEVFSNELYRPIPEEVKKLNLKTRSMMMKSDEIVVNALGYIATPMPFQEAPTAMMTGTIDAVAGPDWICGSAFVGIAKYAYDYRYRVELKPLIMSVKLWNKLSDEDKKIVTDAAKVGCQYGWDMSEGIEETHKAKMTTEYGFEKVIDLTEEEKLINIRTVREVAWPQLEAILGKDLMDMVKKFAAPLP